MVSLDRVGVPADRVPVCQAGSRGTDLQDQLRAAGRAAKIGTRACALPLARALGFPRQDAIARSAA